MKQAIFKLARIFSIPLTFIAGKWLKFLVNDGLNPKEDEVLMKIGVLPVIDHYYQPLINPKGHLFKSLREDRNLPGIDFNGAEQIILLASFKYQEELLRIPNEKSEKQEYYFQNDFFKSGDSEFLYNIIRCLKPGKIFEIGSGASTMMARNALLKNTEEDSTYSCEHVCIEPYEQPWLENFGVKVVRQRVEKLDIAFFDDLKANDILFIDSSHIIRPQGDVLYEYLEILPSLKPGVIVHIHDIFSPKDYLDEWVHNHSLWNEQYLLEAFLSMNKEFKIIGALNFLSHHYSEEFSKACPVFEKEPGREPGSFWIQRI